MSAEQTRSEPARPRDGLALMEAVPNLRYYLGVLRRRVWAVVTAFVVLTTVGIVHAFKTTPVYQAEARILIEKQTPRVMNFQDVAQLEASDRAYYETQAALVRSRGVLEKALEEPGIQQMFQTDDHGAVQPSPMAELWRTASAVLGPPRQARQSLGKGCGPS